jgi:hypothetical protein
MLGIEQFQADPDPTLHLDANRGYDEDLHFHQQKLIHSPATGLHINKYKLKPIFSHFERYYLKGGIIKKFVIQGRHNYASLKRMPLFNFPRVLNIEGNAKLNPIQHRYLKHVKHNCLMNQN